MGWTKQYVSTKQGCGSGSACRDLHYFEKLEPDPDLDDPHYSEKHDPDRSALKSKFTSFRGSGRMEP
jgi:hypothetical protein